MVLQNEPAKRRLKKKSVHLFGHKKAKDLEPKPPVMPPAGTTTLRLICCFLLFVRVL